MEREDEMKMHELYEKIVEEHLERDSLLINSHAYWMADILVRLRGDPAFKKIKPDLRAEIERLIERIK